jgi:hypothetical protein
VLRLRDLMRYATAPLELLLFEVLLPVRVCAACAHNTTVKRCWSSLSPNNPIEHTGSAGGRDGVAVL